MTDERDEVVDDDHGEHECAETLREARADEGEQPERKSGVGRHDGSPAVAEGRPALKARKM